MRTRIFNKMTANEVEAYLARGGNTIYVGVGVVEVHGASPIDVEQIGPEAYAVAMAEATDGLAMINLPYFFPGGTIVSPATVQVSVRESIDFLMMLSRTLVAQGFRKIFYISGHGPAKLYIDAMCRDFFQESKIHVCHLNSMIFGRNFGEKAADGKPDFSKLEFMTAGAYKILHQEQYLPVDPEAKDPEFSFSAPMDPRMQELCDAIKPLGGSASMYYSNDNQHGAGRPYRSIEERDEACRKGEQLIREEVERMKPALVRLQNAIDHYHEYVQEQIKVHPRFGGKY